MRQQYIIRSIVLHTIIFSTYMAITSYEFVVAKDPEPIGTGLRQWLCIFFHIAITMMIITGSRSKAKNRKISYKSLLIHLLIIILIISVYNLFESPLTRWLWDLRPNMK